MSLYTMPGTYLVCSICHAAMEQHDDEFRYVRSGFLVYAHAFSDTDIVCSKACRSQHIYNSASEQEKQMLRCLAMMCEINGSIRKLAVQKRDVRHGLPCYAYGPNEDSVYGKHFDASDLFDLYECAEKVGENLAGDGSKDTPDWYTQAIATLGGAQ